MSGDCVCRRVGERFEIIRADDEIEISEALLAEIELGFGDAGAEVADGRLILRGTNRTVVYALGDVVETPWIPGEGQRCFHARLVTE